jgi:AGZA family xanthine/uracil permease-like MFS transporter
MSVFSQSGAQLARYFEFKQLGTNWRKELLAGVTTFVTMAYIIFVNPTILGDAGLPVAAVTVATCLCAGLASILMGAFARYPLALAPGMGLNAYFAYSVVKGLGVPWQTALGAVFLSGAAFLLLTLVGLRQMIVRAIPRELFAAVAVGIGLFIAFVGLKNAGIIASSQATLVGLGSLKSPQALLALFGLVVTFALYSRRVPGAILIGMLAATALGVVTGLARWTPPTEGGASLSATAFHLDIAAALRLGGLEIIFVFLFVDLFDNLGTLLAVTKEAGLDGPDGEIPRLNRIFVTDSVATMFGSLMGTSTVTSYVESAAGVAAGGRSGVMAIVTGLLFLAAIPLSAVAGLIPSGATTPALVLIGSLMVAHVVEIRWKDPVSAIPAFLTMVAIPLTFSIATGISFGFVSSALLRIVRGPKREEWLLYLLALLCILRFTYLAGS